MGTKLVVVAAAVSAPAPGTKTVRRLAILIGVFASDARGGYFLWLFQVERKAQDVVAKAEKTERGRG